MRLPSSSFAVHGFTLFEVAISLGLVAFGVVSVLMLLPAGIKAQQMSRYQILASARAMEMVDVFSSATDASVQLDREGGHPWDTATSYRAYAPDLETRVGTYRFGMFPLPLEIARRIDSDGDEIQKIISEGGYVYYSQPSATSGFNPVGARSNMPQPNESQRLICAVVGYAQQNAIPSFPYKDWPYHDPYPSPPSHVLNYDTQTSKPTSPWSVFDTGSGDKFMLWEDTLEADKGEMALVFQAIVKSPTAGGPDLPITSKWVTDAEVIKAKYRRSSGYWAYGDRGGWILEFNPGNAKWEQRNADGAKRNYQANLIKGVRVDLQPEFLPNGKKNPIWKHPTTNLPTTQKEIAREAALAYFALAKWYAQRKEVSAKILDGEPLVDDHTLLKHTTLFSTSRYDNPALAVNAARLLAHAATCVTNHFLPDNATDEEIRVGELDVIRETAVPYAGKSPAFVLNRTVIRNYYENAMKLGMRFAASYPYDWGSPRVLNRATMMDFPLMQYDLFSPGRITVDASVLPGYAYGSRPASGSLPAKAPEQWQILFAQPIANLGRSMCYPSIDLTTRSASFLSSRPDQFTLAREFEPADRCRELVFWAVDWQSYEDFETAPSAPVDASRYPKMSPHVPNARGSGDGLGNRFPSMDAAEMMKYPEFHDRHQFLARNPEKTLVFTAQTVDQETGSELPIAGVDNMGRPDAGPAGVAVFSGLYGADRNFNGTTVQRDAAGKIVKIFGKLDRGTVPRSVRLRALQVGRFTYYDPRLPLVIR